jgi:hypothetical protein
MSEIAPSSGGGSSRQVFIILAIGLAGLLILGVIGLGGVFLFNRIASGNPTPTLPRPTATATRLPTAVVIAAATDVPTATPVIPTALPVVTLAPTVAASGTLTTTAPVTTTGTVTPGNGTLPQSGLGEDLLLLVGGVALVLVIFAVRRVRTGTA